MVVLKGSEGFIISKGYINCTLRTQPFIRCLCHKSLAF